MPETPPRFYLTTPIYYVNARPHIGHAYTTIVADVLARRSRAQGNDTWFLTGTDEHGQKIERSAAAANIPPQQFTDQVSREFRALWDRMGLTYNQYIRTTDEPHKRGVQHLWRELQSRGHIYLSSYTGQYCVSEEIFVEGPPGTLGPDGRPTETVTEENYFFRLSNFQRPLLDLIESNTLKVTPEARRNELLSFLRGPVASIRTPCDEPIGPIDFTSFGEPEPTESAPTNCLAYSTLGHPYVPGTLRDLSTSRSSFTWGIPVPDDPKHVIYVWLDALANYMTAVGYGDPSPEAQAKLSRYWPADLHLVGKEIIRQHCIYWPAFLLALNPKTAHDPSHPMPDLSAADHHEWAKLWLPKQVTAHGWLLFEESKMSKSKGNIVRTETILQAFGTLCPPPALADQGRQSPGAPFIAQPHRAMSGNAEPNPIPTGAPFIAQSHRVMSGNSEAKPAPSGAPFIAQSHREMSGNSEANPAPSGAPSSSEPHPEEGGVSGEARPLSSASPTPHQRDLFAADVLRYFLLREIPFGQDGSFSFEALITRYNADLANGYGNLVSRTFSMIEKYRGGKISDVATSDELPALQAMLASFSVQMNLFEEVRGVAFDFSGALTAAWQTIGIVDSMLSSRAPWKLAKSDEKRDAILLSETLYISAECIRIITLLLNPILPYATAAVWRQLGLGEIEQAAANGELKNLTWGGLQPGTKLGPLTPIFPRADKGLAQIMADLESPKTLTTQTDAADAATPTTTEFKQAPIASLTGQRHETPAPEAKDPTHPAAPPRTATLAEPNPGHQVAASEAHTTERPGTPSHTEAASGIFAGTTAGAPFIPELHPGMSGSTPNPQPSGASPKQKTRSPSTTSPKSSCA